MQDLELQSQIKQVLAGGNKSSVEIREALRRQGVIFQTDGPFQKMLSKMEGEGAIASRKESGIRIFTVNRRGKVAFVKDRRDVTSFEGEFA